MFIYLLDFGQSYSLDIVGSPWSLATLTLPSQRLSNWWSRWGWNTVVINITCLKRTATTSPRPSWR